MNSLWLIIWRFQPLHKGHLLLIETSLKENPASLVLIGSVNKDDAYNPYSYETRKSMMQGEVSSSELSIWALPDFPDDFTWKNFILSHIPDTVSQVTLYCWDTENDSAVNSLLAFKDTLPFKLKVKEIPRSIIPVSATQVRKWIIAWNKEKLNEYISEKTLLLLGIQL